MLRFNGFTYEQMAKDPEVDMDYQYLTHCFAKNGRWYEEYREWAKARTDDINSQLVTMFTGQALEAMQQVINISKGALRGTAVVGGETVHIPIEVKDSTVLRAAQDVLDRAGFKAPEHITVESESESMADSIFRRLEEKRALRESQSKKPKKKK